MSLPTPENLKRAVEIVGKIESLKAELTALLYGGKPVKTPGKRGRPAKADKAVKAPKAAKPKRQLSEEARARIIAAQKKRWAKVKKAAKKEAAAEG